MYKFKQYNIDTNKNISNDETRIVTLSDLNWHKDITKYEINDLIVAINDLYPKYLFILGNITNYNTLYDKLFQKKLEYFFDLLSCITNTFLVFGKNDYEVKNENNDKQYTTISNLISIYNQFKVRCINDNYLDDIDTNILGLNLEPNKHYSLEDKKKKIKELINRLNYLNNKEKLNILCTHADISGLKNEIDLLNYFDLIISKGSYNIPKPRLFNKTEVKEEIFNKFIIENSGLNNKEEMDLIKVKKL